MPPRVPDYITAALHSVGVRSRKTEDHRYVNSLGQSMLQRHIYDPNDWHNKLVFPGVSPAARDSFIKASDNERRALLLGLGVPLVSRMENWKLPIPLAFYADGRRLSPGEDTTELVLNTIPGANYGTKRRVAIEANNKPKAGFIDNLYLLLNNWNMAGNGGRYAPSNAEKNAEGKLEDFRRTVNNIDNKRAEYNNSIEMIDPQWTREDRSFADPRIGQITLRSPATLTAFGGNSIIKSYLAILQHELSHNNSPVVGIKQQRGDINPNRIVSNIPGIVRSPDRGYYTTDWGKTNHPEYHTANESASGAGQMRRLQLIATGKATTGWDEYLKAEMKRGAIYRDKAGRLQYNPAIMFGAPVNMTDRHTGIADWLEAENNFKEKLSKLKPGTIDWKRARIQYHIFKTNRDRLFRTAY